MVVFLKAYTYSDSPATNCFSQAHSRWSSVISVLVTALVVSRYKHSVPAYFAIRFHIVCPRLGDMYSGMSSMSNTTRWILPLNGNGAS